MMRPLIKRICQSRFLRILVLSLVFSPFFAKAESNQGFTYYSVHDEKDIPILRVYATDQYCGAIFPKTSLDIVSYQVGEVFLRVFDQNIPLMDGEYKATAVLAETPEVSDSDFAQIGVPVTVFYESGGLFVIEVLSEGEGAGQVLSVDALAPGSGRSVGLKGSDIYIAIKVEDNVIYIPLPLGRLPKNYNGKTVLGELMACQLVGVNPVMLPNFEQVENY
jgi:hypothetical protein